MANEALPKMQAQATSCLLSFVSGFVKEGDEDEVKKNKKSPPEIMQPYIPNILQGLVALLQKGIQSNYEPL